MAASRSPAERSWLWSWSRRATSGSSRRSRQRDDDNRRTRHPAQQRRAAVLGLRTGIRPPHPGAGCRSLSLPWTSHYQAGGVEVHQPGSAGPRRFPPRRPHARTARHPRVKPVRTRAGRVGVRQRTLRARYVHQQRASVGEGVADCQFSIADWRAAIISPATQTTRSIR